MKRCKTRLPVVTMYTQHMQTDKEFTNPRISYSLPRGNIPHCLLSIHRLLGSMVYTALFTFHPQVARVHGIYRLVYFPSTGCSGPWYIPPCFVVRPLSPLIHISTMLSSTSPTSQLSPVPSSSINGNYSNANNDDNDIEQ